MTDLTKLTMPVGLLDEATRAALTDHLRDGGEVEYFNGHKWCLIEYTVASTALVHRAKARALRPMSLDWSAIKDDLICAASDENGRAYAYNAHPERKECDWVPVLNLCSDVSLLKSYDRGEMPWDQSLIWRPGHEPEGEQ